MSSRIEVVFTETIRRSHAYNYRRRETGLTLVLRGLIFFRRRGAISAKYRITHFRPDAADTVAMQKFEAETRYYNNSGEGCWFTGAGSPLVSPCLSC